MTGIRPYPPGFQAPRTPATTAMMVLALAACTPKESTTTETDGSTAGSETGSATGSGTDASQSSSPTDSTAGATDAPSTTGAENCDPNDAEACAGSEADICHPDWKVCVECLDTEDCCPGLPDPMCVYICNANGECVDAV